MKPFAYETATDLDAAVTRLAAAPGTRPLAGGTDLLTLMKAHIAAPDTLLDIKRADGLHDRIEITDRDTTIGMLATLAEIERHAGLHAAFPALVDACGQAASPQLRAMATIGGNLLQRPRCWYFRSSHFNCWLKGGDECFAVDGENQHHALFHTSPCVAVHPSDPASALLALDATVAIHGADGLRLLPLADLFAEPDADRRTETTLRQGELIAELRIPAPAPGSRSVYLKAMDRKVWAFALVGVAATATIAGGVIADSRIVLTGVAPIPYRVTAAEDALRGNAPAPELFTAAAEAALAGAQPLAHNAYKLPLAKALIVQALEAVTS